MQVNLPTPQGERLGSIDWNLCREDMSVQDDLSLGHEGVFLCPHLQSASAGDECSLSVELHLVVSLLPVEYQLPSLDQQVGEYGCLHIQDQRLTLGDHHKVSLGREVSPTPREAGTPEVHIPELLLG